MRVFRRNDVTTVRVIPSLGAAPILLNVVHVDLYFFLDLDLVLLNIEVAAQDLVLSQAQELLHRFSRGYTAGWDADGQAQHCLHSADWLDNQGRVLAQSDANQRESFMAHVSQHRVPRISAHWAWLLLPLVSDHSDQVGQLRYRQIEYDRMPLMAYLALDKPQALSRQDFLRLGLVTGAPEPNEDSCLPFAEQYLSDFEQRYCYDRFWTSTGAAPQTRYLYSGYALVVVGDANTPFFTSAERGVLAQFRHQHFLLFLIAHFQPTATGFMKSLSKPRSVLCSRCASSILGWTRCTSRSKNALPT